MPSKKWTILEVLRWTTNYFKEKDIPHARVEAEVVLAHALGLRRIDLYLMYDKPLSREELATCRKFIKRRANREPSQYITGHREFWSLDFEVNPDVLIPRPETEILVEKAINCIRERSYRSMIDIGTGSGIIAVSIAHEIDEIDIVATDISPGALFVARKNARKHNVLHKIRFAAMDLFQAIKKAELFDVIVSNPPYVATEDYNRLEPEIRVYEPPIALIGGKDGLDVVKNIIRDGLPRLKPGGMMFIEIGYGQADKIRTFTENFKELKSINIVKDYSGINRVVCIEKNEDGMPAAWKS